MSPMSPGHKFFVIFAISVWNVLFSCGADRRRSRKIEDEGRIGGLSRVSPDPDEVGEEEDDHEGAAGFELLKETG